MRTHSLFSALTLAGALTGCFTGLLAQAPSYQATSYLITDTPKIVAMRVTPPVLSPDTPLKLEALILAPQGQQLTQVTVATCGTGRDVQTAIFDLNCFEDPDEYTPLAQGSSLPLVFDFPETPTLQDCNNPFYVDYDTPDTADTAWGKDTSAEPTEVCAHFLPMLVTATVGDRIAYASDYALWFPSGAPDQLGSLADIQFAINAPESAAPGDELVLSVIAYGDYREATFHWYVDAGVLKDTGVTGAHQWIPESQDNATGATLSTNRLVVPQDYSGTLRVYGVMQEGGGFFFGGAERSDLEAANMVWIQSNVEVR